MIQLFLFLLTLPVMLLGPGFALRIEPQACPMCVTANPGMVSLFDRPWVEDQAIGLLAHNYLAGGEFDDIEHGDRLTLIYPGQRAERYQVTEIRRYPGRWLDEETIYQEVYQPGKLTLQTCIGNRSGFVFIIAEYIDMRSKHK